MNKEEVGQNELKTHLNTVTHPMSWLIETNAFHPIDVTVTNSPANAFEAQRHLEGNFQHSTEHSARTPQSRKLTGQRRNLYALLPQASQLGKSMAKSETASL